MMLNLKLPQEVLDWIVTEAVKREVRKEVIVKELILSGYALKTYLKTAL